MAAARRRTGRLTAAARRGVDVCIITPEKVDPERLYWHPEARELAWKTIEEAEGDEFDIAVATWWRTVYDLHRVRAKTYCYFVQSIESRFCGEHEIALRKFVDSTYMLPLPVVTEASWIREYLKVNYGLSSIAAYSNRASWLAEFSTRAPVSGSMKRAFAFVTSARSPVRSRATSTM